MKAIICIILIFSFGRAFSQCGSITPTVINLNVTAPNEIYRPSTVAWQPGDTIRIIPTYLTVLEIYSGGGTDCYPIVIVANTNFYAGNIRFKGTAHHYKIVSTNSGLDTTLTRSIIAGNVAVTMAHHIQVIGMEIFGGSIGFYCKQDPIYSDTTTWGAYHRMTGNKLIGNFIHDIHGEGTYIGHTSPTGAIVGKYSGAVYLGDTIIIPIVTDSLDVSYNYITRTDWDGLQISNARMGNIIHHNIVTYTGLAGITSQKAGILIGSNTHCHVYNNQTKFTSGNAMEIFGFGEMNVYNNVLDTANEASFFSNSYSTTDVTDTLQKINFYNNKINNPPVDGALRMYNDFRTHAGHVISNNTFCIPAATGSWQANYIIINGGKTLTNNILSCEGTTVCMNCIIGNTKYRN